MASISAVNMIRYCNKYLFPVSRPSSPQSSTILSSVRLLSSSKAHNTSYPLPWPHHAQGPLPTDRLLHRIAGLFLLRRVVRNWDESRFDTSSFLNGAKDAILLVGRLLFSNERNELEGILQPKLFKAVETSFSSLPQDSQGILEIESIQRLELTGVRSVFGTASPGDEHVVSWLGQKIITSKSKMESLSISYSNGRMTFKVAKELGEEATQARMEFLLAVSFLAKERYRLVDKDGSILDGAEGKVRSSHHQWIFGSTVDWNNDVYPFQWRIYDINNYLSNNVFNDECET